MAAPRRTLPKPPAVARVLERVIGTIRAQEMIGSGQTVVACVSGGPDSLCMLESLVRVRRLFRIKVEVFHFDHRLRPDSGDDATYVRRAADRLGVPFHLRVTEDAPSAGDSVEAWARLARLRSANELAKQLEAQPIAMGHTLDDQAETVLLNLIRGSGLEGLSGIEPGSAARASVHGRTFVHPLIEVRRAEVEAFCRALKLRPRRDPMNDDTRLLRAAIRHEVLPAIERAVGRDVKGPLVRTAEHLRADRRELQRLAVQAYSDVSTGTPGRDVRFDVAPLLRLSPVLARRVIRMGVYNLVAGDPTPWTRDAVDAVLDLAQGRPGRRRDLPNGSTAVRERGYVHVSFAPPPPEG